MFLSYFTHRSIFILLFSITAIELANAQDAMENNEKSKVNEPRKIFTRSAPVKPQQIPCDVLGAPMDRLKSALKELELMNELYCAGSINGPPVEASRVDAQDETQINSDPEIAAQYNHGHNTNSEQDPVGQRAINYPMHYQQPWMNYPNLYQYNYADRSAYQNPNYYYAGRSPYVQLYSANPSSPQPQSLPMLGGASDHHAMLQGIPADMTSAPDDNENDDISMLKKKAKKYDRHCGKKRTSKRLDSPKMDESDNISALNDTDLDMSNSTEMNSK